MKKLIICMLLLGAVLICCGCTAPLERATTVTGTVTTAGGEAFGPGSIIEVRLVEISQQDAPPVEIGSQTITNPAEIPVPFTIEYDPAAISEENTYAVAASVSDTAGNLLYVSTTNIPAITQGNPTRNIEIVVETAG
jgi:putative lipoprotein